MKTNILLPTLTALFVATGANAAQYRPVKMSYGAQTRPFIGVTLGAQTLNWKDTYKNAADIDDITMPQDFFSFGIETGFRFGNYHEIYNGGLSLNFDISTGDNAEYYPSYIKVSENKNMSISATYDNYIRLSGDKLKRIDLVLGFGGGAFDEITDYDHLGTSTLFPEYPFPSDDNSWSAAVALKAGFEFEITENISLSTNARMFIPLKSDYDIGSSFIFGGSVKYIF
nr:hypothetical protein [Candidatus Enterousia merdequi]